MSTTNILDLNNRIDALEKNSGGGGSADSAKRSDIATEFSATTAYTAGCFVYYEGKLYQFNADHAAGAWDPTDVVEANVTDQIVSNKSAIDGLTASDIAFDNTGSGLTATDVQGALNSIIPRTASGTTAAQLVTAIGQLSETQKTNCVIDIVYAGVHLLLRRAQEDYYTCILVRNSSSSNGTISQYYLNTTTSKFSYVLTTGTTSTDQDTLSMTSWTLYYQGTPIS